ncbi:MAG: molecular chaperone DnaJ [Candidatus Omnitrophica bacterium]|nr:molecular chaperone DnaJ [Candidatus Omnitrophota bacterium]
METLVKRDYYDVLGIDRNADDSAIKQAYRRLAIKCHPDRNPGDRQAVERMKELNEAYAVLSDPQKRQRYDAYGHSGLQGYTADDIFGAVDFGSIFREFGLRNIFSDFGFGFGSGRSIFDNFFGNSATRVKELESRKGADLECELEIELEEAFSGTEKKINLPRTEVCPSCRGTGAARGGISTCKDCGGTGQIVREQRSGYSVFRQITTCRRCRGQGRMITTPCHKCQGKGSIEIERDITVQIPKGADTGHMIKVEGEGEAGSGRGEAGDLYIKLCVKEHPIFERRKSDIYVKKEITVTQALLGGKVYGIPGLEGDIAIQIPEGTEDGTIIKVLGQGMPKFEDERGDEHVIIKVALPKNLSQEEKALLYQFGRMRMLNLDPLYLCQPCPGFPELPSPNKANSSDKKKEKQK